MSMLYMSLPKIQPDVKPRLFRCTPCWVNVAMEIPRVGTVLPLCLTGVNGATFCLVRHPCYFDVSAIPLPDQ